ncbi:aspartate aminotransferase family protein [Anaerotalea alkaliphila]|uniref:Acetylornithine aminotransferase n=1 Tax=Anaerotalea alkaliphila TaxID=2662126 RepID=A0A7X5HUL1_9FIRM|nr:aspartate aminotransferase family protein [Anaerotalea alkaliphila]NDL66915.1 aspartate aminotransferase family protein [Anaerotalea alkaliphila]
MHDELLQKAKTYLMNNYKPFPVIFETGHGCTLVDDQGKSYLDFVSGIAVNALGYGNERLNKALKEQLDKFTHCSNLYYNIPSIQAAEILVTQSGMGRVFFCNSGTEAIEASLKLARKYAKKHMDGKRFEIVAMRESFHGRTYGAISATGQLKYQKDLDPLLPGIRHAVYNDLESVREAVGENTCAILLEPIQGEGGIIPASREFLQGVRQLCDERGLLMILDEVQTGMGRTGKVFAHQHYGIKPDILALAKGLGSGIPIGACIATEEAAKGFEPGDHAATFGGNPLSTTAAKVTLDVLLEDGFLEEVSRKGEHLQKGLRALAEKFPMIQGVRGNGLMQGLVLDRAPGEVVGKAMEKGLLLVGAGSNVVRFVPPLVVGCEDLDKALAIVEESLKELQGDPL